MEKKQLESEVSVKITKQVYRYESYKIEAEPGVTEAEVREAFTDAFPELANAEIVTEQDGTKSFVLKAGEKGC